MVSGVMLVPETGEGPATAQILVAASLWKSALVPEDGRKFSQYWQEIPLGLFQDAHERGTWMILENLCTLPWESSRREILEQY